MVNDINDLLRHDDNEEVLLESTCKPMDVYGFFCIALGVSSGITLSTGLFDGWKFPLLPISLILIVCGIRFMLVKRGGVYVTNQRLLYYKIRPTGKSLYRIISIPLESIEIVHFLKHSVMFGDKVAGELMIKQKSGKKVLLPSLCEGEYVAACVGKEAGLKPKE